MSINNKIQEQVEFYFSDANLRRDKFLKKKLSESADGFVPIDVLLTFNRMRSLSEDKEVVVASLANSAILKLSEDKERVARVVPFQEEALDSEDDRTLFVNHIGDDATIDSMKEKFSKYGAIDMVRIPRPKHPKKRLNNIAFIVFASADSVAKAVADLPKQEREQEVEESEKFNRPMYALNMKGYQERKLRKNQERKERKRALVPEPKLHAVGNMLRLRPLTQAVAFQEIAAILADVQTAKFIDINRDNLTAIVRFGSAEEADKVVAHLADTEVMLHEQRLLCERLDEQEQMAYWKEVEKNQNASGRQPRSKRKGNKRQRDEPKSAEAPTSTEAETDDASATKKCKTEHAVENKENTENVEANVKQEQTVKEESVKQEPTAEKVEAKSTEAVSASAAPTETVA